MKRFAILVYGLVCYVIFLGTFLYAIWFVYTMDATPAGMVRSRTDRLLIDAGLLALFALQHSIMARQFFKKAWTRVIPAPAERSTYVLCASIALLLLIRFWQPLLGAIWTVSNSLGIQVLHVLFALGWVTVLLGTFLIDHAELFGLKQVWCFFHGKEFTGLQFATPGPYKFVRHPIYVGFIVAFWSTPTMTTGHLFFAIMTTAYILVAIQLEERDLVSFHGEQYLNYRKSVSMLTPWPRKKPS
jgi:protein-S-isoprenylcysteine O-methyltransferase Ste14